MISKQDIENWFTYHEPTPDVIAKYKAIREAAKYLAQVIVDNTNWSDDQSAAIRHLRECVMTANAAIACEQPYLMGLNARTLENASGDTAKAEVDPHAHIRFLERQLKDAHDQLRRVGGVPHYDPSR